MDKRFEYTPDLLPPLKPNEIFVFGSNTQGIHGGGAALLAYRRYGAILHQAKGLQGQSYGIVTKNLMFGARSAPLQDISNEIKELYDHAKRHPDNVYYVTKIGCGLGGFDVKDIALLFHENERYRPSNVVLPKEFSI